MKGRVKELSFFIPLNAPAPISVTVVGTIISVKDALFAKAFGAILPITLLPTTAVSVRSREEVSPSST